MARKIAHPISLRLDEQLIKRLDKLAAKTNQTRSKLMLDAIKHYADGLEDGSVKTGDMSSMNDDIAAIKQRLTLLEAAVAATPTMSGLPDEAKFIRHSDTTGSIVMPDEPGYDDED